MVTEDQSYAAMLGDNTDKSASDDSRRLPPDAHGAWRIEIRYLPVKHRGHAFLTLIDPSGQVRGELHGMPFSRNSREDTPEEPMSMGNDNSRLKGWHKDTAVLCLRNEYVKLHVGADYCFPDSERELKEDFAEAVARFRDFIVASSLPPVTRSDLDDFVEKRRTELLSNVPKTPAGTPRGPKTDLFVDYQADGREKRRADVAKILAVPRPPVMNPCF